MWGQERDYKNQKEKERRKEARAWGFLREAKNKREGKLQTATITSCLNKCGGGDGLGKFYQEQ